MCTIGGALRQECPLEPVWGLRQPPGASWGL